MWNIRNHRILDNIHNFLSEIPLRCVIGMNGFLDLPSLIPAKVVTKHRIITVERVILKSRWKINFNIAVEWCVNCFPSENIQQSNFTMFLYFDLISLYFYGVLIKSATAKPFFKISQTRKSKPNNQFSILFWI